MKHFKLIPAALVVAALSACHQGGVGVDSTASQKAATTAENGLRSDRGIQSSTAAQSSIQMPAAPLMINALSTLMKRDYLPPPSVKASGPFGGGVLRKLIWQGSMEQPQTDKDMNSKTAAVFGLLPIAASAYPWQGWPYSCFGCAKEATWARGMARQVGYANLMLTELYPSLSTQALADPSAAQAAVQAAWKKLPPQTVLSAWQQAGAQVAQGGINFDFTGSGPAPVHFLIGNDDFQASPTGWKWSQAGVVWFGDGAISGKQVSLSLASAIDKTASQSSTTGTTTGTGTERGAGGSAGVE